MCFVKVQSLVFVRLLERRPSPGYGNELLTSSVMPELRVEDEEVCICQDSFIVNRPSKSPTHCARTHTRTHNSIMALLTGSHPSRLLPAFVTQIAVLICSPSVFSSSALSEPDLKSRPLKRIHMFPRLTLLHLTHTLTHVSTRDHSLSQDTVGLKWDFFFPSLTAPVTTHTCSVTLMEMTELQECLEVTALTDPQPLGNVCRSPPARRKCHHQFASARVTALRGLDCYKNTQSTFSRTDIYSRDGAALAY